MLVPAPWRDGLRPGQALQDRHAAAPVGHRGGRRQDRPRRRADGGGPHQQVGRRQRPADRAARRRLRVQARRRPAQGGEAGPRGQDRRPRGRLPLQRLPGLHAGVRGAQARQHDQRCASTPRSPPAKCSRYTFRPFDFAPAQAVAFAPYMVNKMGKKWHIAYADYAWGQSTRDAYVEQIKKAGGEVVGHHRHPARHRGHDAVPLARSAAASTASSGSSSARRASPSSTRASTSASPRSTSSPGDGAIAESTNLPALGSKVEGFVGINRYVPVLEGAAQHARPTRSSSTTRSRGSSRSTRPGPLPDRYVQSNFEAINSLKLGMQKSGFRGPRGHHEAHRGARGHGDQGERRLPAGRQDAPQGGPPGLPARVHLRASGAGSTRSSRSSRRKRRSSRRPASSRSA